MENPTPHAPRLLGILCHWCSYSAADAAAAARLPLPPGLSTLRVMCTGRIAPELVVEALRRGADGVLVCGCHLGDCHYNSGNHKALGRLRLLARMLADMGMEPGRLRMEWVSAGEAERYAELAHETIAELRELGPLRWPTPQSEKGPSKRHG